MGEFAHSVCSMMIEKDNGTVAYQTPSTVKNIWTMEETSRSCAVPTPIRFITKCLGACVVHEQMLQQPLTLEHMFGGMSTDRSQFFPRGYVPVLIHPEHNLWHAQFGFVSCMLILGMTRMDFVCHTCKITNVQHPFTDLLIALT